MSLSPVESARLEPETQSQPAWHTRLAEVVFWFVSASWQITTENAISQISRFTGHLVVLALVTGAAALSGTVLTVPLSFSQAALAQETMTPTPAAPLGVRPDSSDLLLGTRGQTWRASDVENVVRAPVPRTEIPSRLRRSVFTYTVQPGDTVQGIALTYGIQPETIMWSNSAVEDAPDYLQIGQQLVILPVDGVYHMVAKGDTLESIAKKYKATIESITGVSFNNLQSPDYKIEPGMKLIVAGGEKPYVPKVVTAYTGSVPQGARGTGRFQWPVLGTLTQGYWWGHRALDLGAATGSPVRAADGGFVSFAGWTDIGYGNLVVVDHANGYATYYAHLSGFRVYMGQSVQRGQLIGLVGSTGNSSGPHLHFEIRFNHTLLNPGVYLP